MNKVQKIVKIILCSYMSVKVCQYFQKIIKNALTEKKPNKKQAVAPEKSYFIFAILKLEKLKVNESNSWNYESI